MMLLGVVQTPEIRFTAPDSISFAEGKADIKGTLTLNGVSKPLTLQATLNHIGKSPQAGGMWNSTGPAVGLSMRGSFKRADFGITDNPELPSRFGDTITLLLEAQALKQ
jgi:polyisoprenoid-binding protein YceI